MPARTIGLLVLSSLVNAVICGGAFLSGVFATDPQMADVTMRIGFYVLNTISFLALIGVVAPWVLAWAGRTKPALIAALAPTALLCLALLAFFTLDNWLGRNFS